MDDFYIMDDDMKFKIIDNMPLDTYDIKISSKYKHIPDSQLFSVEDYISDILASYSNNDAILEQLQHDFPRIDVYVNNKRETDLKRFIKKMEYYSDIYYTIKTVSYKLSLLLMMMPNQSSFYLPYVCLFKIYNKHDFVVTSSSDDRLVNIDIDKKRITIQSCFNIKNKLTNKITDQYIIEIILSLGVDNTFCYFGFLNAKKK